MEMKLTSCESAGDWTVSVRTQASGQIAGYGYREVTVMNNESRTSMTMRGCVSIGGFRSQHKAIQAMKAAIELVETAER
jgi:uncharacterized protein (DUF2147 family)